MSIISCFPGGSAGGGTGMPEFTYTGTYQLIDDGGGNWRMKFLTSGVLTFTKLRNAAKGIDVFLVGGGGGNGNAGGISDWCAAGGGGYTKTVKNLTVQKGVEYQIVVGAGGTRPTTSNTQTRGGTTSAFNASIEGGYSGKAYNGGDGGSGGAASNSTVGGTDGGDGGEGSTTTREFGESTGDLYASGGYYNANNGTNGEGNGADNTGNGAGGTNNNNKSTVGGSGIVVVRNHRKVAA